MNIFDVRERLVADYRGFTSAFVSPRDERIRDFAVDLRPFAMELDDSGPPFRWDSVRRTQLQAELDACFFHLYGLSREDTAYVLDTFPIVRRKDEAAFGEFRTKRLILEAYDAMAEATVTGVPYVSPLDPPPGHGPRHESASGS